MSDLKQEAREFNNKFSSSEFWLDPDNYPKNFNLIKKHFLASLKEQVEKTEISCERQYREFIEEVKREATAQERKRCVKEAEHTIYGSTGRRIARAIEEDKHE